MNNFFPICTCKLFQPHVSYLFALQEVLVHWAFV